MRNKAKALPKTENYVVVARIWPASMAVLPLACSIAALSPLALILKVCAAAGSSCCFLYLSTNFVRDRGSSLQAQLFESWGGEPAVIAMTSESAIFKTAVQERYRAFMHLEGIALPEATAIRDKRAESLAAIESAVAALREWTRKQDEFPFVQEENRGYGFRRNMLGMKPIGIWTAVITIAADIVMLKLHQDSQNVTTSALVSAVVSTAMLGYWAFVVNPGWVRQAANRYAKVLWESCDLIAEKRKKKPPKQRAKAGG